MASFGTLLGLPVVLLGFTQPNDNAHAPNEWMDLRNYETAIRAVVRAFDELAATARLTGTVRPCADTGGAGG